MWVGATYLDRIEHFGRNVNKGVEWLAVVGTKRDYDTLHDDDDVDVAATVGTNRHKYSTGSEFGSCRFLSSSGLGHEHRRRRMLTSFCRHTRLLQLPNGVSRTRPALQHSKRFEVS